MSRAGGPDTTARVTNLSTLLTQLNSGRLQNTDDRPLPVQVRHITLDILDEVDSGVTEIYTIELRRNQSLFAILCAKRPNLRFWYHLRSVNSTSGSFILNLRTFDNAQQTVDRWGQSLFEQPQPEPRMFFDRLVLGHLLRLTLDPPYPAVHLTPNKHRHVPAPRPHGMSSNVLTHMHSGLR